MPKKRQKRTAYIWRPFLGTAVFRVQKLLKLSCFGFFGEKGEKNACNYVSYLRHEWV